ncbi:aminodeoxychorismate synthase component I [Chelativorans sp. SCAU2101]|uniref:Aminodeoxychorismate synthase component I n=1 Tax=Chelativorans petroleitrophicus TaxID=2975484 RepID=A0A9X3B5Y8_9HYPH|nr:aminodeoxychorismate synthase component I [Chelativorans petroleitrophicus]MCT8989858.1 aminodeoxychorismate synthase component I [Chelativorans petroleitrophicus]
MPHDPSQIGSGEAGGTTASLRKEGREAAGASRHDLIALFRNDLTHETITFSAPQDILLAEKPEEFVPALRQAEEFRRGGKWLAGYVSYEAGYLLDASLVPHLPEDRRAPLLCLGVFDGPSELPPQSSPQTTEPLLFDATPAWRLAEYEERFARLHHHIRMGDCYQGNLTFPVSARWQGDPLRLFERLMERQPVRYAAFIDLAGPVVLSRSPELFFEVSADGWIETLPMKGTMPRGKTTQEDAALKEALRNDPKNQAENRMIVDLLRNDISRISEVGTLDVPELFRVESYPTVHQMVSRIRARLLPGSTLLEILAALFPCGSVTGAPKISAMKILRSLEVAPRDVYCGAIGWVAPDGRMRFNVAIRTISLYPGGEAVFNVGGGVVFDSTAEAEYQECLLKARFTDADLT